MTDRPIIFSIYQPKLLSDWHEGYGDVLWWKFPITEPPYVGTPLDFGRKISIQLVGADGDLAPLFAHVGGWPGYHTHWTPIVIPQSPPEAREVRE